MRSLGAGSCEYQADLCKVRGTSTALTGNKPPLLCLPDPRTSGGGSKRQGAQMKSRRQSTSPALVSLIVFPVTVFGALGVDAQTKPPIHRLPQLPHNQHLLSVQ